MAGVRFLVQLIKRCLLNRRFRNNQPESLRNTLFQFKRFLQVEIGLGEVTVEGYLKMAKKFIKDISGIYPSRETILSYILDLHAKKTPTAISGIPQSALNGTRSFLAIRSSWPSLKSREEL